MTCGIYRIRCRANGGVYIGSSVNMEQRFQMHRWLLDHDRHHSIHLMRAWHKYGAIPFDFESIETGVAPERLIEREQFYMDLARTRGDTLFNIAPHAGRTKAAKRTPEQIERMAARFRGKSLTAEHKAKIAPWGRSHSAETREKIRRSQLTNPSFKGRQHTEESRARMSSKVRAYFLWRKTSGSVGARPEW